jgi:hypothetical protein
LYSPPSAMSYAFCTLHPVPCHMLFVLPIQCHVICSLYSPLSALSYTFCTRHPVPYHIFFCTPHPVPCDMLILINLLSPRTEESKIKCKQALT